MSDLRMQREDFREQIPLSTNSPPNNVILLKLLSASASSFITVWGTSGFSSFCSARDNRIFLILQDQY